MTSSFPSFASFPELEEDAPERSKDKEERRKREKARDKDQKRRKGESGPGPGRALKESSKCDRGRGRRDKIRHRERDNERKWQLEDDEQDKGRQDRLLAQGQEPESRPGTHPWSPDFKGDPKNITLKTLYKGDVLKFRRAERE